MAVPQAVGIADDGRVVFGWCGQCLLDTHCNVIEISARGIADLKLSFSAAPEPKPQKREPEPQRAGVDQSIWLVGLVGFLMVAWGTTVLCAGFLIGPGDGPTRQPSLTGSPPMLRVGGTATILMGVMFLTMAANRDREFRRRLTGIVRWGGLVVSGIIGIWAIFSGGLQNKPLPVGWAICLPLILSAIAYVIEDHANRASPPVKPWEFPVVSYSEIARPEGPRKRI
ncbi:MAG: hypothetical protein ABS79_00715 [Planctomycetes bacterium SCN 63-9]|nr:MAG: hypothetical protein ABS79_00715 [Planctomycetes bacterium SCN 63-9]